MQTETYRIVGFEGDWRVRHAVADEPETTSIAYATKEGAFEAAVTAASNAVKDGVGVSIQVPPRDVGETNLGGADQAV